MQTRPIIVYDGVCYLCNHAINFVIRHQRNPGTFFYVPFQSEQGSLISEHFNVPVDDLSSFLLIENGKLLIQSTAWIQILRRLTLFWRLAAALMQLVPTRLRNIVYDYIGRKRYRWFGQASTCMLPTEKDDGITPDIEIIRHILNTGS